MLCIVAAVGATVIWSYTISDHGFAQLSRAVNGNGPTNARCSDRRLDVFEDQWAKINGLDRQLAMQGFLDYCGNVWPWALYRAAGVYTGKTLATISRASGVDIR